MVFLEVEMQKNILIPSDQLVWAIIFRWWTSPPPESHLMNIGFFVDVTSGGKIGEGRIRDLTGDVLFPVTCKRTIPTTIPTMTMTNPGHCWCVMSNKALMDVINCANLPRPWTGALTPRMLANWTSSLVEIFSQEPSEDAKDWLRLPEPVRSKKNEKVKILLRQK